MEADLELSHPKGRMRWTTDKDGVQQLHFSNEEVFRAFLLNLKQGGLSLSRLRRGYALAKDQPIQLKVGDQLWYSNPPGQGRRVKYWPLVRLLAGIYFFR
jgi:hypothetical protein